MLLLIPGPVTTHPQVRAAMSQDFAPWDYDFRTLCKSFREKILDAAGLGAAAFSVLPLQGCGHFAMEAAIRTLVPESDGRLLVPLTGSYGLRMARLAREAGRQVVELFVPPTGPVDPALVAAALAADPAITHVGLVYSETSSGVVHDPVAIGAVARAMGRRVILDAVSAFGALPLDLAAQPEIDAAVFTANKCLEAMPGLSLTIVRNDVMERAGPAGSWSFDLGDVYRHGRGPWQGAFRFTPPAQVVAALDVALDLHRQEGGSVGRLARYSANASALYAGMQRIGLQPDLPLSLQGPIVLNVCAPNDPAWTLQHFVEALKTRGYLISNFYDTPNPSFRVGCIGQVTPDDMVRFTEAVDRVLTGLGVRNRQPARQAA